MLLLFDLKSNVLKCIIYKKSEEVTMLELLIVVLLVYVSYKLSKQEGLMKEQNELIDDLRDMQDECRNHVERLENMHDIASDK